MTAMLYTKQWCNLYGMLSYSTARSEGTHLIHDIHSSFCLLVGWRFLYRHILIVKMLLLMTFPHAMVLY